MNYRLIRSERKTVSIEIGKDGIVVRAPLTAPESKIEAFVESKKEWIEKSLNKYRESRAEANALPPLTRDDIIRLGNEALRVIPERAAYYASKMGVEYGRITIRNQTTRWGSCSAKKKLNFNCLLMLTPPEVIDSVVVHELCHLIYMNHSPAFYAEVRRVFPDYDECDRWLKKNGPLIINRMTG